MRADEWINLRSFSHQQFNNAQELLSLKEVQGYTISLCLPALNEAETIGKIISTFKKELQEKVPLLDEIILIDSGSTDGTQEIARRKGVPVFQSSEILPEMGNYRGKGENLWKSLFVSKGDIIVWLDTDIKNIHPRFVLGLLGPLLYQREVCFVKGYYRRPLQVGRKLAPTGGGRVTEILVKPFFNLLFPELALFNQPLSGEYAGRRELLERVPFFTGYGVETGLLIDIEQRFGLSCMAQVDLDVRIHRNQDLQALRRMAFGILRVLLTRAEQQGKILLMNEIENQLISVFKDEFQQFRIEINEINEIERPPMITISRYQKRRQLSDEDLILLEDIQKKRNYSFVSLSRLLSRRLIILDGGATEKEEALREISQKIVETRLCQDYPKLIHEFFKRENTLSTGIGSGVAIPHITLPELKQFRIIVYRSDPGVRFDSLDGQPVHLIFAVIGPATRRNYYLQILANLSNILKDAEVRNLLLKAQDAREFVSIFRKVEVMKRFQRELRMIES